MWAWVEGQQVSLLDLWYQNVSLLLPMDGMNGSTKFLDYSSNNVSFTVGGNVQVSTTQSKFGGASAYFDGSGDYLSTPDSEVWNLSINNFTIEFWANGIDKGGASAAIIIGQADNLGAASASWAIIVSGTLMGMVASSGGGSWDIVSVQPTRSVTSAWAHYAFVRNGNTLTVYEDGASIGSGIIGTMPNSTRALTIGNGVSNQNSLIGYIDDLRITKGYARYVSNFTPPGQLSLAMRPSDDSHFWRVSLLLHMNGENNSISFLDSSSVPKMITRNGDAKISTTQSKFGGASAYFDGSGDYLSIPYNVAFDFGSGDMTIETLHGSRTFPAIQNINRTSMELKL